MDYGSWQALKPLLDAQARAQGLPETLTAVHRVLASFPILTVIVFVPLLGAVFVALLDREKLANLRGAALFFAIVDFLLSLPLLYCIYPFVRFDFQEQYRWIPSLGITYHLGADGVSAVLVTLTTLLTAVGILASFGIQHRVKEFMCLMLALETGILGVFVSLDLFLFYIFWEVMLIPMAFLIGVWGGTNRIYAAVKFVIYTMVGSLLMLVGILVIYFMYHSASGQYSMDLLDLERLAVPLYAQMWLFFAFFLAFAIKVPMFPFHTWLPDAHTEAPTAGSVILAGILLKMGTYGFYRLAVPMFPEASARYLPTIVALSIVGIIYGALVCLPQRDAKRLIAYSSVSHLGFAMLGLYMLNPQGVVGSVMYWVNHGLSTGALFLLVGVIYDRRHTRMIADYGGLAQVMPAFAAFFLIAMFSSVGLPGLNGFVGEFLVVLGAFLRSKLWAALAATGIVLGAIYMLWMYQRVMQGPIVHEENKALPDMNRREWGALLPLAVLMFAIGLYPKPLIDRIQPSAERFIQRATIKRNLSSQPVILIEDEQAQTSHIP
ncbi:MAG: complex I subunit 4 family protein [Armatimonadota bacterium]